jgi:predicted RNase H-like HicB family nuclease
LKKTYKLTAVVWKEKEGYVSKCPELGIESCGDSAEDALQNLKKAAKLHLESVKDLGTLKEVEDALKASGRLTTSFEVALKIP